LNHFENKTVLIQYYASFSYAWHENKVGNMNDKIKIVTSDWIET